MVRPGLTLAIRPFRCATQTRETIINIQREIADHTEVGQEMKSFRCGDVMAGCTASFTGTADDILVELAEHARQAHQLESVPPALITQVRAAMQPA